MATGTMGKGFASTPGAPVSPGGGTSAPGGGSSAPGAAAGGCTLGRRRFEGSKSGLTLVVVGEVKDREGRVARMELMGPMGPIGPEGSWARESAAPSARGEPGETET